MPRGSLYEKGGRGGERNTHPKQALVHREISPVDIQNLLKYRRRVVLARLHQQNAEPEHPLRRQFAACLVLIRVCKNTNEAARKKTRAYISDTLYTGAGATTKREAGVWDRVNPKITVDRGVRSTNLSSGGPGGLGGACPLHNELKHSQCLLAGHVATFPTSALRGQAMAMATNILSIGYRHVRSKRL